MRLIQKILRHMAHRYGRFTSSYVRFCNPSSYEYADYLRKHGGFMAIGKDSRVNPGATITDPYLVRIGDNCAIAACHMIGHNGAVGVLNKLYGKKLDSVGKIDVRDNSFVGYGAIVLPDVTIGPNSIVAAGSVVNRDVPPGMVVAGVPAKPVCTTEEYALRLEERTHAYPWNHLIQQREGDYDPAMEPELRALRLKHFYG